MQQSVDRAEKHLKVEFFMSNEKVNVKRATTESAADTDACTAAEIHVDDSFEFVQSDRNYITNTKRASI